ncbi:hypothetical protein K3495_g8542 [Podosphaera aphanis]|nr:hypothetical protein K3495_g8542 [Podosphaera aphanis]
MFQWLSRIGQKFKEPMDDTPNYLGAYSPDGSLRRVVERVMTHRRQTERLRELIKKKPEKSEELLRELEEREKKFADERNTPPELTRRDMMPFPANKDFVSEPVLGPWLQNQIWEDVMLHGMTVREVSAQRGVEMSRVAAVVRLLEVERLWKEQGKEISSNYAETVLKMLPYTGRSDLLHWSEQDEAQLVEARIEARLAAEQEIKERKFENAQRAKEGLPLLPESEVKIPDDKELKLRIVEARRRAPHESINDLPILKSTGSQLWLPVSESRRFTRADAAKAFHSNLQPADKRVPHPELTIMHKEWLAGLSIQERTELQDRRAQAERQKALQKINKKKMQEDSIKKVVTPRGVVFRFHEIKVDAIGKNGRGTKAVGCRYGVPNMDRSKGDLKIPQHALVPPRHMPAPKSDHWQKV